MTTRERKPPIFSEAFLRSEAFCQRQCQQEPCHLDGMGRGGGRLPVNTAGFQKIIGGKGLYPLLHMLQGMQEQKTLGKLVKLGTASFVSEGCQCSEQGHFFGRMFYGKGFLRIGSGLYLLQVFLLYGAFQARQQFCQTVIQNCALLKGMGQGKEIVFRHRLNHLSVSGNKHFFCQQSVFCHIQQHPADISGAGTGVFFQKKGGSPADKRGRHGSAAHADIMLADDVFPAAALQGKIIVWGKDGNDIISPSPKIGQGTFFPGEEGKGGGQKILSVFPCAYGYDAAADCRRRAVAVAPIGVPCGGDHNDARLPEPFRGFFQGQIDLSVIGADGKIHYSDIIFTGIVHYPSKSFHCLNRISLTAAIQDLQRNDIGVGRDAAPDPMGKMPVSAGDTRDMGHGIKTMFLLLFAYFCGKIKNRKSEKGGNDRVSLI